MGCGLMSGYNRIPADDQLALCSVHTRLKHRQTLQQFLEIDFKVKDEGGNETMDKVIRCTR